MKQCLQRNYVNCYINSFKQFMKINFFFNTSCVSNSYISRRIYVYIEIYSSSTLQLRTGETQGLEEAKLRCCCCCCYKELVSIVPVVYQFPSEDIRRSLFLCISNLFILTKCFYRTMSCITFSETLDWNKSVAPVARKL